MYKTFHFVQVFMLFTDYSHYSTNCVASLCVYLYRLHFSQENVLIVVGDLWDQSICVLFLTDISFSKSRFLQVNMAIYISPPSFFLLNTRCYHSFHFKTSTLMGEKFSLMVTLIGTSPTAEGKAVKLFIRFLSVWCLHFFVNCLFIFFAHFVLGCLPFSYQFVRIVYILQIKFIYLKCCS